MSGSGGLGRQTIVGSLAEFCVGVQEDLQSVIEGRRRKGLVDQGDLVLVQMKFVVVRQLVFGELLNGHVDLNEEVLLVFQESTFSSGIVDHRRLQVRQALYQLGDSLRGNKVGSKTGLVGVQAAQNLTGQGVVVAQLVIQARQEEGGTHIWEKANVHLGHGQFGLFSSDTERSVHRQTHTTAHGDAVHQGHIWFQVGGNQVIDIVFLLEEVGGVARVPLEDLQRTQGDIATSTQGLWRL